MEANTFTASSQSFLSSFESCLHSFRTLGDTRAIRFDYGAEDEGAQKQEANERGEDVSGHLKDERVRDESSIPDPRRFISLPMFRRSTGPLPTRELRVLEQKPFH